MKRLAYVLALAVLSVAALFLLLGALIPRDAIKTRIGEQISGWTGRDVSLSGEPRISLFPRLRVRLDDVRVGGPADMTDAEILTMDRLEGTIRLIPLLIGRIEVDSFTMVRPLVHLVRDEAGRRNWRFDSGAAALQLAFAGDVPLGTFRLEGGSVLFEDRSAGTGERLDSVDLTVDWQSVRHPMSLNGSAIWRGEQVKVTGNADAPFAYLNGSATPLEARVESAPISVVLTGAARDYPHMRLSGALRLSTPSLRRFAGWLGSKVGSGSTFGEASVFGQASLDDGVLSVADAQFTLDGNAASGALTIAPGQTLDVAGTLAFGALDLTRYFSGLSAAAALESDWRRIVVPTAWLTGMSADVRLSADSVALGSLTAGSTAASVSLSGGRLEVGLARAAFGDGGLSGGLEAVTRPGDPEAQFATQLRATQIDLSDMGPFLGLPPGVSGAADAVVDLTTRGRSLGDLVTALGGVVEVGVDNGAVPLFGLADLATGDVAEPTTALTPVVVTSAAARVAFQEGVGAVQRASAVTSAFSAEATGNVDLLAGRLAIAGTLRPATAGATVSGGYPFTIEGDLTKPVARRQSAEN